MTEILGRGEAELRTTRTSVKWRVHGPEVLPLWVAEMDAGPCPEVVAAVSGALSRGDTGYAWPEPLVEAFTGFAQRRWSWHVEAGRVLSVPDVMIAIAELIRAHVPADRAVLLSPPVYDSFFGFVEASRRRLVEVPLRADHRLDLDGLDRAFRDAGEGSAYVLCHPQNPTGTIHSPAELTALALLADRHGVLVISDEIHAPLVQPGAGFTPYLALPAAARGLAVVSGSKAWNLAGLKTALVVPGPEAEHGLHEVVTHGAQHLAVIAQTAAYEHGEPWLDRLLAEIADRRAFLTDELARRLPGVRLVPAEATYLAWADCSGLGLADPAQTFLERGVALVPGPRYDRRAGQWVRINLATSREVLAEAVRRMAG